MIKQFIIWLKDYYSPRMGIELRPEEARILRDKMSIARLDLEIHFESVHKGNYKGYLAESEEYRLITGIEKMCTLYVKKHDDKRSNS